MSIAKKKEGVKLLYTIFLFFFYAISHFPGILAKKEKKVVLMTFFLA